MTVKQLKQKLAKLPANLDVYVAERKTEFAYGLVNSASVKVISFSEDPGGKTLAKERVLILDEE